MFNKILVCLDGSPSALAAARAGASLASQHNAEILGLNVFDPAFAGTPEIAAWAIAIDQNLIERRARDEKSAIERATAPIFCALDTPHRVIQEAGHPVETILRVADREKVDLIIVGSRGMRGIREVFLGSVSSAVMHHALCPVLIVHGTYVPTGVKAFQHIVLASDGSIRAQKAAAVAIDVAQKFATSLTVLNVTVDPAPPGVPGEQDPLIVDIDADLYARRMLELVRVNVGIEAKDTGVPCSYVQKGGHPYESIVRFVEERDPDLLVLGSRGLGGFQQMLVGSVSNYVAHHVSCPILVVH